MPSKWSLGAVTAIAVVLLIPLFYDAYVASRYFDGYFANGAFQLLNPLRRLDAGHYIGTDFFFFHGIGTVFWHYPVYKLLGSDLFASELARHIVSPVLFLVSSFIFTLVLLRSVTQAIILSVFILLLVGINTPDLLQAGNSLLGLRSTMPVLFAAFLYWGWSREQSGRPRIIVLQGIMLALCLITSIEQGAYALLAYLIVTCVKFRREGVFAAKVLAVGIVCYVTFLWAGGAGFKGVLDYLDYAYRVIPLDQPWYFGTPPNMSVWIDSDTLTKKPFTKYYYFMVVAIIALGISFRRHGNRAENWLALYLVVSALASLISVTGLVTKVNFYPALRATGLGLITLGVLEWRCASTASARGRWLVGFVALFVITLLNYINLAYFKEYKPGSQRLKGWYTVQAAHDERQKWIGESVFGVYLSPQWSKHMNAISEITGDRVKQNDFWSIYAGLPELKYRIFNPSRFDYIIQGLGMPYRYEYLKVMQTVKPKYVRLDNTMVWPYGTWLMSVHWDLYRYVFVHYDVAYYDKWGSVWVKKPEDRLVSGCGLWQSVDVSTGAKEITLPLVPAAASVVTVELDYDIVNPLHGFPVVGRLPRYLVGVDDALLGNHFVPLPDKGYEKKVRFPIFLLPGSQAKFGTKPQLMLGGVKLSFKGVRYCIEPLPKEVQEMLMYPKGAV